MTEKNDKVGTEHEEAVPEVTLAEQLIAARERSGYTVDRAAAATRITAEFISGLESGKHQKLPGIVFVRGFIKSLAKLYNTPAEPLIASLERENGEKKPAPAALAAAPVRETQKATLVPPLDRGRKAKVEAPKETEASSLGFGKKVAYGVAAVVALILVVVIAQKPRRTDMAQHTETPQETKAEPPAQTVPVVTPETAAPTEQTTVASVTTETATPTGTTAVQEPAQTAAEPGQNAAATVTAPITGGLQELRVVAKNPVRLRYKKDAEQWVTQDLKPDTHTFHFKDSLQVMVYDAAAVDVFFNGKNLGNLGTKGRIRRLNFQTADLSKATAKKP